MSQGVGTQPQRGRTGEQLPRLSPASAATYAGLVNQLLRQVRQLALWHSVLGRSIFAASLSASTAAAKLACPHLTRAWKKGERGASSVSRAKGPASVHNEKKQRRDRKRARLPGWR